MKTAKKILVPVLTNESRVSKLTGESTPVIDHFEVEEGEDIQAAVRKAVATNPERYEIKSVFRQ